MTPVIKMIALLAVMVVVSILESFWLQSILEHFDKSIPLLACYGITFVIGLLTPKALNGLVLLALFVTQCYIWIF